MNIQQVFNKVVRGLARQDFKRSVEARAPGVIVSVRCRYRGKAGLKCAIGQLIPDCAYDAELERYGPHHKDVRAALIQGGVDEEVFNTSLLSWLQMAHDCSRSVVQMKTALAEVGLECGLTLPKELA